MPVSSSTEHWIKPDALTINLNHFGDPDYLQVSLLAGAVVMAFKQDVIGYNAAHNYRTWPLEAANTYLETSSAYNVYARLTRSEVNARALVIYDPILRDVEGREITYEKNEETGEVKEILGEPNENFYFIFLGQLSSSISEDGRSVFREWTSEYRSGSLETNEQLNDWMAILNKMFRPHYDDPLNPDTLTWIEAKAHMGIAGGLTSFIDNRTLNLPSIYDGLVIDNQTIYWEEIKEEVGTDEEGNPIYQTTKVLKAQGGGSGGGGVADSVDWAKILNKPTTIEGYGIADEVVSSNNGKRKIWGQSLAGTDNITGDLTLGNTSKLIIPSFYDYHRFEVYANDEGVFIGASDKQGRACANGNITIGGIKNDKFDWWLSSLKINADTKINGDLILSADDDAKPSSKGAIYFGGDIYGASMSSEKEKQLSINAQSGVLINGGLLTYNKKDGYFQFDGNLVVTGGLTTFADSGAGNQWIMDAETLEEVTSKNEFKVYSAKVTSMIVESISEASIKITGATGKLEMIKTAFSKLSSSSSASDIGRALNNLASKLQEDIENE
jgi:hypothetical protein